MNEITIVKVSDLDDEYKKQAVALFLVGFGHIFSFVKKIYAMEFFSNAIDFSMVHVAMYENRIVGFLSVSNHKKRPLSFDVIKFKEMYGNLMGGMMHKKISAIMDKPLVQGERDLAIDFLVTDEHYRGKGIATKLITFAIEEFPCDNWYIEVFSKNLTARKLYEKLGFAEFKRDYSFATFIQGLGYLIKLKK